MYAIRSYYEQITPYFENSTAFQEHILTTMREDHALVGEEMPMVDGRVMERDFVPIQSGGAQYGYLWQYRDISQRKRNNFV